MYLSLIAEYCRPSHPILLHSVTPSEYSLILAAGVEEPGVGAVFPAAPQSAGGGPRRARGLPEDSTHRLPPRNGQSLSLNCLFTVSLEWFC